MMRTLTKLIGNSFKQNFGNRRFLYQISMLLRGVPTLDITDAPELKFLLIKIYEHGESGLSKLILRGAEVSNHTPIYLKIRKQLADKEICTQCVGGGTLFHNKECKVFTIVGECKVFGKADPEEVKDILKRRFMDYTIKIEK